MVYIIRGYNQLVFSINLMYSFRLHIINYKITLKLKYLNFKYLL